MKPLCLSVSLFAAAILASVLPEHKPFGKSVVYWGQATAERELRSYCAPGEGADIIVLAFISTVGGGQKLSGNFGNECDYNDGGNCSKLKADINYCKSRHKKILVSVGGQIAKYSITSQAEAEAIALDLWYDWGAPSTSDPRAQKRRPIGDSFVDGWDFDIESSPSSDQYLGTVVTKLRSLFANDPKHKYIITGAPQCPIPEVNMGKAITSAKFDHLFIQFYNNPYCSAFQRFRHEGGPENAFNYDKWVEYTANTPSADAKLFIGLPASEKASTGTDVGKKYYLSPEELAKLVKEYRKHPRFGGVMLWDAGNSDTIKFHKCNYLQNLKKILKTGRPCTK